MRMFRIVSGSGAATAQDILALAMKLGTAARELGLAVVSLKASHASGSPSRYLTLRDGGHRHWLIRVSNHRMPIDSDHALPHLDLVSLDGASGLPEATAYLQRIAAGTAPWANPADPARRADWKRHRPKNQKKRPRK